jgi:phosphoribosylglycinamide formyltransferase-1
LKLNRVVNIHPSLLPSFPGKNGYGDAFDYGVKVSGVTVHFVDDGIDTGPILLQESFVRDSNDTLESFKTKGLELEHLIYPKALDMIMNDQIEVYTR